MTDIAKSSMKKAADILILIGTILGTIGAILGVVCLICMVFAGLYGYGDYYFYYDFLSYDYLPIAIMALVGFVLLAAFLVLSWIAYAKTIKGSNGWAIYGVIQAVLSGGVVSIVGYILALVDLNAEPKAVLVPAYVPEKSDLNSELAAAKVELATLKMAQSLQETPSVEKKTEQVDKVAKTDPNVVEAPEAEKTVEAEEAKEAE